jgi:hypothetical protein
MKSKKALMVVMAVPLLLLSALVGLTQEASFGQREQNFREYVTLLRTDVKAERKNIITQMMQFDADDAAVFWPIFQEYDTELTEIGDGRVQLIMDYARNYENLSDDQADMLMTKAFELEGQRAVLKKKYFDRMKKAIGAGQAAKFYLIENQLQHIVDLQISAELPTVKTASK